MQAYVIVGAANTRKSSLVRCLTGCARAQGFDLQFADNTLHNVYVELCSLQEKLILTL